MEHDHTEITIPVYLKCKKCTYDRDGISWIYTNSFSSRSAFRSLSGIGYGRTHKMSEGTELVEVNLNPPTTPEERSNNIIGNIRLARGANLPFIDNATDEVVEAKNANQLHWAPKSHMQDVKPSLKYFAVGPSSYQIKCPLCGSRADTETVRLSGACDQLHEVLAILSCCFPIFSLSFLYCCLSSQYKSKRMFCNKCGGHLSFYDRPV